MPERLTLPNLMKTGFLWLNVKAFEGLSFMCLEDIESLGLGFFANFLARLLILKVVAFHFWALLFFLSPLSVFQLLKSALTSDFILWVVGWRLTTDYFRFLLFRGLYGVYQPLQANTAHLSCDVDRFLMLCSVKFLLVLKFC